MHTTDGAVHACKSLFDHIEDWLKQSQIRGGIGALGEPVVREALRRSATQALRDLGLLGYAGELRTDDLGTDMTDVVSYLVRLAVRLKSGDGPPLSVHDLAGEARLLKAVGKLFTHYLTNQEWAVFFSKELERCGIKPTDEALPYQDLPLLEGYPHLPEAKLMGILASADERIRLRYQQEAQNAYHDELQTAVARVFSWGLGFLAAPAGVQ